jgi:hypothetical protein
VRELVETEKSYIGQLIALDECYMTPLLREAAKPEPPIPIKMCDVLFLNVRRYHISTFPLFPTSRV